MGRCGGTGLATAWRTEGSMLLAAIASTLACSTPGPLDEPIDAWSPSTIFGQDNLTSPERSGEILLALTFSGGGPRAAALSAAESQGVGPVEARLSTMESPWCSSAA